MLLGCHSYKTLRFRLHLKQCNLFGSVKFTKGLEYKLYFKKIHSKTVRLFARSTVRHNGHTRSSREEHLHVASFLGMLYLSRYIA